LAWSDGLSDFAPGVVERIRAWIAVEVGPGRLVPWLTHWPGVAIYLAIDREPALWRRSPGRAVAAASPIAAPTVWFLAMAPLPWQQVGDRHREAAHYAHPVLSAAGVESLFERPGT
jgi:hypothetical protein